MTWRLKDFMSENRGLDEAAFLSKFPHPFLVSEGQGSTGSGRVVDAHEATRKFNSPHDSKLSIPADDSPWIVPLKRRGDSKHNSIITVGRGEECDLRLAHPLVSKRHAYFSEDPEGWLVADAESTNFTFADGNKLEPHKPHRLADSEALRFGPGVKYRFFGAKAFHAYVALRARMKEGGSDPRAPKVPTTRVVIKDGGASKT